MRKGLAFLLLVALLLGSLGCGDGSGRPLSLDEYREQMLGIQENIIQNLNDCSHRLQSLTQLDYYDLIDLENVVLDMGMVFASAKREAMAMHIPPEVESLHEDLISFYSFGQKVSSEIASSIAFFRGVLPMLTDVENLALPNMVSDAEVSRIKAAAVEDASTMHSYAKDLTGMKPPPRLEPYKEILVNFFHSIENAVADVDRAIMPEDRNKFLQFKQDFSGVLEQRDIYRTEMLVYLFTMGLRLEYLARDAGELETRIQRQGDE